MIRFLIVLTVATLLTGGASWLLFEAGILTTWPSYFYQTLILVPLGTFFIYRFLIRLEKPDLFTQFYLLTMVVKLIAFLAYMLLIILEDRAGAVANAVFFLVLYVIFTTLEVAFLYRRITPR